MNTWKEWKILGLLVGVFLLAFYLPVGFKRFDNAVFESLYLVKWYAREHVILCLIPAFFIAGAISVFISQGSVMRYLGAGVNKVLSYSVAAISGTVLAVCSCTVLPLFAGIYSMGAGLGPAVAFLYSGPAINVLAIILTARILGVEIGVARGVGAVVFAVIIGLIMHLIYRKQEREKAAVQAVIPDDDNARPLWQNALFLVALVGILIFTNWGKPAEQTGIWHTIHSLKWTITGIFALGLTVMLPLWFGMKWSPTILCALPALVLSLVMPSEPIVAFVAGITGLSVVLGFGNDEGKEWLASTWHYTKQILPLLLIGVVLAGLALGRPGHEGLIPSDWIAGLVGGNSVFANFFASFVGAFMYFATLTEVPILQGLIGNGMGKGPALALLLAGPALSLPNMLVIRMVIGTQKTLVFVGLVVVMATVSGIIYGAI